MSFFSLLNQFNARNDLLITPNELKRRHIRDARRCFKEKKSALFYSKEQLQELRILSQSPGKCLQRSSDQSEPRA